MQIKKVAVIGAGVMGAGIAAQAANGGAEVLLLDQASAEGHRNQIAQNALDRFLQAGSSGGLMHSSVAERIQVGNIEDDLSRLAEMDWVVEAIVERLEVKQQLYRQIEQVRGVHTIVSSNTSTIPLKHLLEGFSTEFCQHFVVTHYFNPPRYMRLVEVVAGDHTLPEVVDAIQAFNDQQMGKTVIHCADRPGFIANRLGVYWMQVALQEAIHLGLSVEDADAVMQQCGFPKTGIFGLWDLCGIDLMPEVTSSLSRLLPQNDALQAYATTVPLIHQMLNNGWRGRKGKVLQGFYRQYIDEQGQKHREVLDLVNVCYREIKPSTSVPAGQQAESLTALLAQEDSLGRYAWRVLSKILAYATQLVPDVAENIQSVDSAMTLGYNWNLGPFALLDQIGVKSFCQRYQAEGGELSAFLAHAKGRACYQQGTKGLQALNAQGDYQLCVSGAGILTWAQVQQHPPIQRLSRCALWSLSEQVWCVELNAKINSLGSVLLDELSQVLDLAIQANKALVLYSNTGIFAAGADLKEFLLLTQSPDGVDAYIQKGQRLFQRLENAPVPIVAAVSGKALGGGLELLMHCHHVQAYAESQLGLVETSVGIVPGWGGCRALLRNTAQRFGADQAIAQSFALLAGAKVSASALEAQQWGYLRAEDGISLNSERVLFDALTKAEILWHHPEHLAQKSALNTVPSLSPAAPTLTASGYQHRLETALLDLLNQACHPNWYPTFYENERACNTALVQQPETLARIEHLLTTGRSLRN
ncbi:3-hydroxyacyl-CoA dehydrogenase [Oceanospirillum multiglobuliferum]|uniref:Uncharacterized protein n=1 Tax=Oceanospirillum multiglobuliferum TaxID=64969 RepID=A0A1T4KIY5_9GAMM|nr:3-hydroxyacyl-CoA dehydrogenase/enoyl-CoA hydratase family protein [Oceanospirillum multiglobuliferum]OPX56043.1 hypothetical protein BTE48_05655 [Oceanospirillum multiglobuliferum]SJZ42364.1 3-hydroxyacyl-CoA dehydrogenase [Oceanospirillum multiglobuliferum]